MARLNQDGVKYPFLDGKGHTDLCDVWTGPGWMWACNCGAATPPDPQPVVGFPRYTVSAYREVFDTLKQRYLVITDSRGHDVVGLADENGKRWVKRLDHIVWESFWNYR